MLVFLLSAAIDLSADAQPQIFQQLSNKQGSRLYKMQKRFQAVFGFTLRNSVFCSSRTYPLTCFRSNLPRAWPVQLFVR